MATNEQIERPSVGGKSNPVSWLARHWLWVFTLTYGAWVALPLLAPVFMQIGWETPGQALYGFYSFFCHQLPQRSFFLFGQQAMYPLPDVQSAWVDSIDPFVLRRFTGSAELGWKVAWSDRMVSMYSSVLFFAWLWAPLRRRIKPLPVWGFILLLLPMAIDGGTHLVSDFAGLGQGFRDSNLWLAELTSGVFSPAFYGGDALGSFNSWMRLLTGTLFGLAVVWFGFPYLEEGLSESAAALEAKHAELDELSRIPFDTPDAG